MDRIHQKAPPTRASYSASGRSSAGSASQTGGLTTRLRIADRRPDDPAPEAGHALEVRCIHDASPMARLAEVNRDFAPGMDNISVVTETLTCSPINRQGTE